LMSGLPVERIGSVTESPKVRVTCDSQVLIDVDWDQLRDVWRSPLDFA
jgi:hypothetical protein